ncbi:MAG: WecB/TagA/CpsF family glycosyltransferase [Armatimonadota bacterium]|nr:WecB/TagA/CpsF family glycosyltransferase [Armatimonadota bacterium]
MTDQQRNRVEILGIGVDTVTMAEALIIIEGFIKERVPRLIVTADAAGIVAAQSDPQWRSIMESADLVTPDSVGVLWAAERAGNPIVERVSGVDLVEKLVERSVAGQFRIFFLGAAPGIAEKARKVLQERYQGANIIGVRDGYFNERDEAAIVDDIRELEPDVLFVAMGIPKQEKFIRRYLHEIGASVNMGIGGSFDVLSGSVKRAPLLLQRMHLEWLWRLIQNPKKWRKVAALPTFWWLVMLSGRGSKTD